MNIIKAYFILNLKALSKDKIPFMWSILFPSFFVLTNQSHITNILDLRFYWSCIIFYSFILGIGLNALNQKEHGTLRTFFSIKFSRWEFFVASLLSQMVLVEISLVVFNLVVFSINGFDILKMTILSNVLLILMIPVAFLSFNITLLNKIHFNSLNSLCIIIMSFLVFAMGIDTRINIINPLVYTSDLLMINTFNDLILYIVISAVCILTGCYSIYNYSVLSNEVR